jgi:hypothetical protein
MAPRATAWAPRSSTCDKKLPNHLPSFFLLLRQRRVAAGNGLGTGLGTTIKYVRQSYIQRLHLVGGTSPRVIRYICAHGDVFYSVLLLTCRV